MTAAKNLPPFVAHTGGNQEQSIVGVVGTLGTSDTGGTASIMPIGVNPSTGAMFVQDLSGASGTTNIQGTVAVSSVIPGTSATSLGKAEDNAHTSGDVGVMTLAVRNDAGTVLAGSDGDYVPFTTDATGAMRVDLNGIISTNNSTTGTLAGGGVFTGTSDDALNYNEIRVSVIASHASAADGLSLQQSSDNTNWDITDVYSIPATTGKTYSVPRQARYVRVVYTNGATIQTSFRMQTILNRLGARVSSQRASDGYTNETDLEQQQTFNMLMNSGTTWDRARGTLGTAFVAVAVGTQQTLGTVGTILGIGGVTAVSQSTGTINTGTVVVPSGTITTGSLSNIALVNAGTFVQVSGTTTLVSTVTTLSNLTNGSVNILTGTLQSSGTTTGVGVVSNLTNGSVNILTGTLQSSGTTTGVGVVTALTSGSVILQSGTLSTGTLQNLNYGTITIDSKPAGSNILTIHTLGTGGGTFVGTMVAPVGAGTYIYLTGFSMIARSGGSVDAGIANNVAGTTGAGVISRGLLPAAGGGVARDFSPALRIGTNGTLAYFMVTAGTVDFTASYWVGP